MIITCMAARFDSGMFFFFLSLSVSHSSFLSSCLSCVSHFLTENNLWKRLEQVYVKGLYCLRACVRLSVRGFICCSFIYSCIRLLSCVRSRVHFFVFVYYFFRICVRLLTCFYVFIRFFRGIRSFVDHLFGSISPAGGRQRALFM